MQDSLNLAGEDFQVTDDVTCDRQAENREISLKPDEEGCTNMRVSHLLFMIFHSRRQEDDFEVKAHNQLCFGGGGIFVHVRHCDDFYGDI